MNPHKTQAYIPKGVHSFRYFLPKCIHQRTIDVNMHFILMQILTLNAYTKVYTFSTTCLILLFGDVMHNAYQLYSGPIWCKHLGQEVPE